MNTVTKRVDPHKQAHESFTTFWDPTRDHGGTRPHRAEMFFTVRVTTPYPHLRQCSDRRPPHPNQFVGSCPTYLYYVRDVDLHRPSTRRRRRELETHPYFFQFITTDKTKSRRGGGKVSVLWKTKRPSLRNWSLSHIRWSCHTHFASVFPKTCSVNTPFPYLLVGPLCTNLGPP